MPSQSQPSRGQTSSARQPWFVRNPAALAEVEATVNADYPDLRVIRTPEAVKVRGTFPVIHEGVVLDRYQVEILFSHDYPDSIPLLTEIGGRIPKTSDRHVYVQGGACVQVPEEWLIQSDRSFKQFLEGPVRNYFISQTVIAHGKSWPFGERTHGVLGLLEAYGEMLGVQDTESIIRYLQCLSLREIKGHIPCPCGSGKRLRKCHLITLLSLRRKISRRIAEKAIERMRSAVKDAQS